MRFLYFYLASLIILFNVSLALAFHDGQIDPTKPLARPEGYFEKVPVPGSSPEDIQYRYRWVPGIEGGLLSGGLESKTTGGVKSGFGGGANSLFGGGIQSRIGGGVSGGAGGSFKIENPLGNIDTIQELINQIINGLIILAAPVVTIMTLWGGFKIMTSAGNAVKYTEGGKIILYAAVGFGILLLAKGVTAIIELVIGVF